MNEINNFDAISKHLVFPDDDQFYYIQIITRKKDGHDVNGNNRTRLIKSYRIKSKEQFDRRQDEIIKLCKAFNARAYIHFTRRSQKAVMEKLLVLIPQHYLNDTYDKATSLFDTACGQTYVRTSKTFLIDVDKEDLDIANYIQDVVENVLKRKVLFVNNSVSGKHIICEPFNVAEFNKVFKNIDIQKNNPTLLYYCKTM